MRKLYTFLLCLLMVMSVLIGCGGGNGKKDKDNNNTALQPVLIVNDNFESDSTANWVAWGNEVEVPTSNRINNIAGFSGYCLKLTTTNLTHATNDAIWRAGCGNNTQFNLKSGKAYTISVKVKSDNPGRFNLVIVDADDPYEIYYQTCIYTSATATVYTRSFNCFIDASSCKFSFQIGNTIDNNNNNNTFYFDEVQISEQTATPITLTGTKLLINGDFETDLNDGPTWFANFGLDDIFEWVENVPGITGFSGHYLHFRLADGGTQNWDKYFWAENGDVGTPARLDVVLKPEKTYTLSFKARSSQTGRLHVSIDSGHNTSHEYVVNTTNTTQLYTCQFVFNKPTDSHPATFSIMAGNPPNTTMNNNVDFYLDDIQLLEQ